MIKLLTFGLCSFLIILTILYFTFRFLRRLKIAYTGLYIFCGIFLVLSIPFFFGYRRGVCGGSDSRQSLIETERGSVFACFESVSAVCCMGTGLTVFLFLACGITSLVLYIVYEIFSMIYFFWI